MNVLCDHGPAPLFTEHLVHYHLGRIAGSNPDTRNGRERLQTGQDLGDHTTVDHPFIEKLPGLLRAQFANERSIRASDALNVGQEDERVRMKRASQMPGNEVSI